MDKRMHEHCYRINNVPNVENNNRVPSGDLPCLRNKDEPEQPGKTSDEVDSGQTKVSPSQTSKSKELQILDEISKGHEVMTSISTGRLLRLNAAQTLWHKDMNTFVEYFVRLDDDAVVVDILPILTKRVKEDGPELSTLSMGACLDMLPVLKKLLDSKYEDYIIAAIDMIREIVKRWWKELQITGKKKKEQFDTNFRCSRSVNGVYMLLVSMTDRIHVLAKRIGNIGEKAKVLQELMALL